MKRILFCLVVCLPLFATSTQAQYKEVLTLEQVIQLAREQSPAAILAKHQFRAQYWQFRTHKAGLRPSVTLNLDFPQFNRSLQKYKNPDGSYTYLEDFANTTTASVSMNQNIGLTGGQLFVRSDLQRLDEFGDIDNHSYMSTPISVGYRQPILFFNEYKWAKKIEPLRYEQAEKQYVATMEAVAAKAAQDFFSLALAQQTLAEAKVNYSNADTLYKIAQGRYEIGTIAENELMQMELSFLNAGRNLNQARVDLEYGKLKLRSFLGFNEKVDLQLIISKEIPDVNVEYEQALALAESNNPQVMGFDLSLVESEREVAAARAEKGLKADLFASFGLTQRAQDFDEVYINPQDQQGFRVGIEMPLLDWGLGKGRYKMAQSDLEVTRATVKRDQIDFRQSLFVQVMQFNLQDDQLAIAAKSDTIAQKRYDLTKQRFLIGKVDVLDLNVALEEKDRAKKEYVRQLSQYWSDYFALRQLTLYDFLKKEELSADFEQLVE
ncbi:MAG: TolC family protein [Bacteroidales bacterium]|jgi:outer membrane protein TolC